jgi:hypothetical protein
MLRDRFDHRFFQRALLLGALGALTAGGACSCEDDLRALPGSIAGNLCSVETGKPLNEHTVVIETVDEIIETQTDLFGQYEVKNVSAGAATVTAEVEGETRTWDVVVESGAPAEINDDMCRPPEPPPPPPTGTVSGCVCDDDNGIWVDGANVFVVTPAGDIVVTGTDTDGCFDLADVPVGSHVLEVDKGAFYESHDVTVTEAQDYRIITPDTCALPEPPPPPPGSGTIDGRVCAPDGTTWLADADIYVVLPDGSRVETTTDMDGNYSLQGVPEGTQVLYIVKGSFTTTVEVEVVDGEITTLPEEDCAIEQNVKIAVIDGLWDDVKSVLLNVGIDPTTIDDYQDDWAQVLLTDYALLSEYDILFFNCGLSETEFMADAGNMAVMRDNLRQWVEEGGSFYASDQAYDLVEVTFPDFVDFHGDDASANSAQMGATDDAIVGSIVDLPLATAMGSNSIELHYPLAAWAVMEAVAAQVRVFIRGNARVMADPFGFTTTTLSNVPHTVSFAAGEGKVVYTSFHQEPGINLDMERVLQLLIFEL